MSSGTVPEARARAGVGDADDHFGAVSHPPKRMMREQTQPVTMPTVRAPYSSFVQRAYRNEWAVARGCRGMGRGRMRLEGDSVLREQGGRDGAPNRLG